jgi:hypothetical protein
MTRSVSPIPIWFIRLLNWLSREVAEVEDAIRANTMDSVKETAATRNFGELARLRRIFTPTGALSSPAYPLPGRGGCTDAEGPYEPGGSIRGVAALTEEGEGESAETAAPQFGQKRFPSGTDLPQFKHFIVDLLFDNLQA